VGYRDYMTLRLPLAATNLAAPRLGIATKLTLDAVTDILTLAGAWEAICPTNPTSSGNTCQATSSEASAPSLPPSSAR
jgi:hypothetical protein